MTVMSGGMTSPVSGPVILRLRACQLPEAKVSYGLLGLCRASIRDPLAALRMTLVWQTQPPNIRTIQGSPKTRFSQAPYQPDLELCHMNLYKTWVLG